jgi:hypothetical protein
MLEWLPGVSNADRVKRWTLLTALPLATSIIVSCMVYDAGDLRGLGDDDGQSGASSGRGGSVGGAGASAGTGAHGGQAGDSGAGGSVSGSSSIGGSSGGNGGSPPIGTAGEDGGGEGGDSGGTPNSSGGMPSGGTNAGSGGGGAGTGAVSGTTVVIDDLEDGNHRVNRLPSPPAMTSSGSWYTYSIPTGKAAELVPASAPFTAESHPEAIPGPEPSPNVYAFRLFVKQVPIGDGNGAAGGFNLLEPKAVYDGSRYVGITYSARASKSVRIRVQIVTKGTDSELGTCEACSDHYFKEDTIGTSWMKFDGYWDARQEFAQENWGDVVPFKPEELVAVQFFVPASYTTSGIELWIDNISFIAP